MSGRRNLLGQSHSAMWDREVGGAEWLAGIVTMLLPGVRGSQGRQNPPMAVGPLQDLQV